MRGEFGVSMARGVCARKPATAVPAVMVWPLVPVVLTTIVEGPGGYGNAKNSLPVNDDRSLDRGEMAALRPPKRRL
jgi:hypothetical protein